MAESVEEAMERLEACRHLVEYSRPTEGRLHDLTLVVAQLIQLCGRLIQAMHDCPTQTPPGAARQQ